MPISCNCVWYSRQAYCTPRSLWCSKPGPGFRLWIAEDVLTSRLKRCKAEQTVLRKLVTSTVPDLSRLSLSDIVEIREDEETFVEFRNMLRDGVTYASAHGAELPEDLQKFLEDRSRELQCKLTRKTSESSLLSKAKTGLLGVGVGIVSAMLGADSWASFLLGAGTVALTKVADDLAESLGESGKNGLRQAQMRHCMVFRPDSNFR